MENFNEKLHEYKLNVDALEEIYSWETISVEQREEKAKLRQDICNCKAKCERYADELQGLINRLDNLPKK